MPQTDAKPAEIPLHLGPGESGAEYSSTQLMADPVGYFSTGYRERGPVFRTRFRGEGWVTIAGIEANDFFWQNPANWSYAQAGPGFTDQFGPTYVTQLDGAPHLRKRRLLKAGFSADAVGRFVQTMAVESGNFLQNRQAWGDDANEWIPALLLTLNKATVVRTELSVPEMRDAMTLEGELIYGVSVSAVPAEHFGRPSYRECKARVYATVDRVLGERAGGLRPGDNLQQLMEQDPGHLEPLTQEELRNDTYMLLVAGIHNTTSLLTRIIERITQDPGWVAELREELAGYTPESFGRGLAAYPKLKATIFEGERLHPGATFLKRRPVKDLQFAGMTIPAGSKVMQAHTLPHFLGEYYDNPLAFRPRRWLGEKAPDRKALADFGGGAHICVGMNLTRIHVPIILAELLGNYDWELKYTPSFHLTVDPGLAQRDKHEPVALRRRA
jgi:cytochrome P450